MRLFMPTRYGESAVIRLLPKDRGVLEISKLGLSSNDQSKVRRLLELPHDEPTINNKFCSSSKNL